MKEQAHVSRINGDEGELDALATYLEAVQVFLRQHIHSRNDAYKIIESRNEVRQAVVSLQEEQQLKKSWKNLFQYGLVFKKKYNK